MTALSSDPEQKIFLDDLSDQEFYIFLDEFLRQSRWEAVSDQRVHTGVDTLMCSEMIVVLVSIPNSGPRM